MIEKIKNISVVSLTSLTILGLSAAGILLPDKDFSVSERRTLAKSPEISQLLQADGKYMSEFEDYALDQFPFREKFRTLKSVVSYYAMHKTDNNGIYIDNGYASKLEYPLNEESLNHAAERIEYIYNNLIAGKTENVYLSVIPDKNYFMGYAKGYPSIDYSLLTDKITAELSFAEYIDIFPLLDLTDYYKTDTHWKQEKISDAAEYITERMGSPFHKEYEVKTLDSSFYGVYCGQAALPMKADTIKYIYSPSFSACKVFDYETNSCMEIYDMEKAKGADPYEMFLGGSKGIITIENPLVQNGRELVVFRDSFGSSLVPYFINSYSKITVADTRYIHPSYLKNYIDFDNADVLFIYSTLILNNSILMK